MRFILLICLVFSSQAWSQRAVTAQNFQVNIRPILNAILGDFYQMISHFPDFPKEIVPLIKEIDSLTTDKETLREVCPKLLDARCEASIKSIRLKLQNLRSSYQIFTSKVQPSSSPYLNTLSGLRYLSEFQLKLEEVKGLLDNTSFLISAKLSRRIETHRVIKDLDQLSTYLSLSLVEFIPYGYREDFRHFYSNFVQPIQQQISKSVNYEYFNRNVNSLNFAINLLNMNLTKKNKKTPEGMAPFLAVIHNRWNSILRYYF